MIVYRSPDRRWRVECTAEAIRVFDVGAAGLVLRYRCRSQRDLSAWLREHARLDLADLVED